MPIQNHTDQTKILTPMSHHSCQLGDSDQIIKDVTEPYQTRKPEDDFRFDENPSPELGSILHSKELRRIRETSPYATQARVRISSKAERKPIQNFFVQIAWWFKLIFSLVQYRGFMCLGMHITQSLHR